MHFMHFDFVGMQFATAVLPSHTMFNCT